MVLATPNTMQYRLTHQQLICIPYKEVICIHTLYTSIFLHCSLNQYYNMTSLLHHYMTLSLTLVAKQTQFVPPFLNHLHCKMNFDLTYMYIYTFKYPCKCGCYWRGGAISHAHSFEHSMGC